MKTILFMLLVLAFSTPALAEDKATRITVKCIAGYQYVIVLRTFGANVAIVQSFHKKQGTTIPQPVQCWE